MCLPSLPRSLDAPPGTLQGDNNKSVDETGRLMEIYVEDFKDGCSEHAAAQNLKNCKIIIRWFFEPHMIGDKKAGPPPTCRPLPGKRSLREARVDTPVPATSST